jgi:hypothetical protein
MSRITTYPIISTVAEDDLLVISDVSTPYTLTKTVTVQQLVGGSTAPLALTTLGTSGPATLINNVLNVPQYSGGGGGMTQWFVDDGGAGGFPVANNDSVAVNGSSKVLVTTSTINKSITWTHASTARTDTTSAVSPGSGGTFTVVDSITQDATGHPTAVNVKTVTMPAGSGGSGLWTATGNDIYNNNSNAVVIGKTTAATDTTAALEVSGRVSQVDINYNTAFGQSALQAVTTGGFNTAIGERALNANTTGIANTAIGSVSLLSFVSGDYNTAMGIGSMDYATGGSRNTAIGAYSLRYNTTGENNVALGSNAINDNTTGSRNVALGRFALSQNTTGNNNLAWGYQAGNSISTGTANDNSTTSIFIGTSTSPKAANSINEIVIGNTVDGNGNNTTTIGKAGVTVETHIAGVIVLEGYTFATLPASPVVGMRTYIIDGGTPTYGGNASGGGSNKLPVFYNGSNWIYA